MRCRYVYSCWLEGTPLLDASCFVVSSKIAQGARVVEMAEVHAMFAVRNWKSLYLKYLSTAAQ